MLNRRRRNGVSHVRAYYQTTNRSKHPSAKKRASDGHNKLASLRPSPVSAVLKP